MRRNRRPDAGVQMATSISVATCTCGTLYIRLHDRQGRIFAAAGVDRPTGGVFSADVIKGLVEIDMGQAGLRCEAVH